MSGWFAVRRGLLESDMFAPKGPYSKYEAWVWMIESAPFKDGEVEIKGKIYPTKRGHVYHSIRFMAGKWRWSEKAVRVFIDALENKGAIEKIGAHLGAHYGAQLKLCNYEKYQNAGHTKGHALGHKEEQGKQIPLREAEKSAPEMTLSQIIFGRGLDLLIASGVKKDHARSMLGKWRKDHGEDALVAALSRAQREGAIEPISFIQGCFKFQAKRAQPEQGDTRFNKFTDRHEMYVDGVVGWVVNHSA